MGAVRKLSVDIISYLKGNGFQSLEDNVEKSKKGFLGLENVSLSTFTNIAAGVFSVSKLMETYTKSIEAANYQRTQEVKLESIMRQKGFREEQIEGMKRYASELQEIGVIGDEVTLAGIQQLAAYDMSEETMKRLIPVMQDMIVKNKGIGASGEDAVDAAKKLVKSLEGEAGELEEIGIFLNEHQKNILETGNEEQRLGVIIEGVNKSIGEQNKAFAATPEGKIAQVQNRIGDVYENIGFKLRKSRGEWYSFLGENLDSVEEFIISTLDYFEKMGGAVKSTAQSIYGAFLDMPPDVRNVIALIGGFITISAFPVAGIVAVITDITGAFLGQKSVTEDVFNGLMNYLDYDYNFEDLKTDIKELWQAFEEGGWIDAFLQNLQASLGLIGDTVGVIAGIGKGIFTGDFSTAGEAFDKLIDRQVDNAKKLNEIYMKTQPKVTYVPIGEDGINYNEPLIKPVTYSYNILQDPKLNPLKQDIYLNYLEPNSKLPEINETAELGPRIKNLQKENIQENIINTIPNYQPQINIMMNEDKKAGTDLKIDDTPEEKIIENIVNLNPEYSPEIKVLNENNLKLDSKLQNIPEVKPIINIPKIDDKPVNIEKIPDIKSFEPLKIEKPIIEEKHSKAVNVTNKVELKNDIKIENNSMTSEQLLNTLKQSSKAQTDYALEQLAKSYGGDLSV